MLKKNLFLCKEVVWLETIDNTAASVCPTSCLLASRPSKLTKQLICNRKSMKTAMPAKSENVLTAGMLDRAPAEGTDHSFLSTPSHKFAPSHSVAAL